MQAGWRNPTIFFLVFLLFLLTGPLPAAGGNEVDIKLNGERLRYDVSPYIDENSRTIVPVRFVAEDLGGDVEWDRENRRVEIVKGDLVLELWIDEQEARVNGEAVALDTSPALNAGRTMVPIRFVSETFGLEVEWERETRTVLLHTAEEPEGDPSSPPGEYPVNELETKAVVNAPVVNVREGPNQEIYEVLTQAKEGTVLSVSGKSGDWYRVLLPGEAEKEGWIAGWLLELEEKEPADPDSDLDEKPGEEPEEKPDEEPEEKPEEKEEEPPVEDEERLPPGEGIADLPEELISTPDAVLVMKDAVNVRIGAGLDYGQAGQVRKGHWLEVREKKNGWYRVSYEGDGGSREGWVAGWLVAPHFSGKGVESPSKGYDGETKGQLIDVWQSGSTSPGGEAEDEPDDEQGRELPGIEELKLERFGEELVVEVRADARLELPRSFRLDNPSRLVFDFQALLQGSGEGPSFRVDREGVPVKVVRTGQFDEETVRLVFELSGAVTPSVRFIEEGRGVQVTIRPFRSEGQTVVIDPGHGNMNSWGGTDPGAIGPSGITEREVVMEISLRLGRILQEKGISTIFTRIGETSLGASERAAAANISGSELLLSIHANAAHDRNISGTMTFYCVPDSELKEQLEACRGLAELVQEEMLHGLRREDKGVRTGSFTILRQSRVPAALAEVAFISNPEEEKLLSSPDFQQLAAESMAKGIERFLARTGEAVGH